MASGSSHARRASCRQLVRAANSSRLASTYAQVASRWRKGASSNWCKLLITIAHTPMAAPSRSVLVAPSTGTRHAASQ
ncbi:hypothetical protein D3C80_1804780 [compost metagenome]